MTKEVTTPETKDSEEILKKKMYKNIQDIKDYIQIFFWLTIIGIIITFYNLATMGV